ncbi:hypothetical protein NHQ30_000011 [Ciborinia camelliae]|nr:hypothetical protein NHQ30_000011 [Ciborinia camelliae]
MAILNTTQGQVEVRIKRYPDHTYYDEYIKVERKEEELDDTRERYIVAEAGTTYYIEVTLKEDFNFGEYNHIQAALFFPGRKKHISSINFLGLYRVGKIEYADVDINGQKVHGARFAFRSLEMDETLFKETDIMGILPENLVTFSVNLYFCNKVATRLSNDEYNKALSDWEKECSKARDMRSKPRRKPIKIDEPESDIRNFWDAKKVDQDSYKKHGITSAIGFVGGKKRPKVRPEFTSRSSSFSEEYLELIKPTRTRTTYPDAYLSGTFLFHCRTAEFLEQVGIIKYPPPLHYYAWNILSESERKTAFQQLQDLSKTHWHEDQEKETGMKLPIIGRVKAEDHPWEWRQWKKMYAGERQKAFKSLQDKRKARERGIIQRQYKTMMGKIIALDEDDKPRSKSRDKDSKDTKNEKAKSDKEGVKIKREEILRKMAESESLNKENTTSADTIKDEPIDLDNDDDLIVISETKNPILNLAPKKNEAELADEELRKEEAALEKLKEDIVQEERVLKMKRERDALQERIDAARSKKRIKTE